MFFLISFLQLVNNGPSRISNTLLELHCPLRVQGQTLLYPLEFSVEGPINCTSDKNMNHLRLKVSRAWLGQWTSPAGFHCMINCCAVPLVGPHPPPPPSLLAPPRTLTSAPLWSPVSSLCSEQLDEPPRPATRSSSTSSGAPLYTEL